MAYRQSVTDYKFSQFKNYKVFTTRQWCENKNTITTVIRENNGKWQFLTEEIDLNEVRSIPLVELVDHDPTLNELHKLKRGHRAARNSIADEWQIIDERRKPFFQRLGAKLNKGNSNFHGALHIGFALIVLRIFFGMITPSSDYLSVGCFHEFTYWDMILPILFGLAMFLNGFYVVLKKKLIAKGYRNLLFILLSPFAFGLLILLIEITLNVYLY